jgi:hypothetical protein
MAGSKKITISNHSALGQCSASNLPNVLLKLNLTIKLHCIAEYFNSLDSAGILRTMQGYLVKDHSNAGYQETYVTTKVVFSSDIALQ